MVTELSILQETLDLIFSKINLASTLTPMLTQKGHIIFSNTPKKIKPNLLPRKQSFRCELIRTGRYDSSFLLSSSSSFFFIIIATRNFIPTTEETGDRPRHKGIGDKLLRRPSFHGLSIFLVPSSLPPNYTPTMLSPKWGCITST